MQMFLNSKKYPFLMTPGPVHIPMDVMDATNQPLIHHRTDAFEAELKFVLEKLPLIFKTTEPVFLHTSTGSGAMESAIVNTLSTNDKVLCVIGGKFGERWSEISKAYGLQVIEYKMTWGEPFEVSKINEILKENPDVKAVMVQACETSTGVANPIEELGNFLRNQNCILIVDAITALGATQLNMDAWNLDVVVGGSQKAFMLPTGLSMISFSKKAWSFVGKSNLPKHYWDIKLEKKANEKMQTYFSSPVTLIRGLKASLEIILKLGIDDFIKRHELIAQAVLTGGQALGLTVFAKSPSSTVTAFLLPENINSEKVQKIMQESHFITIAGGQDHLKGKIIRIGHMGAIEPKHVVQTLKALSLTLNELGHATDYKKAVTEAQRILKEVKPLARI